MPGEIDEIKARIDVVDLIGEYIRLKQAGTNWKALCPFHNEKTPSFMVSRDKQIWHCFGCSEGGDIFTFVQKIEHLEFPEVLRLLAQKAGVQLSDRNPQETSQRNRLLDICQLAAKFWHKILLDSPKAEQARQYLQKRKLDEKTIADFQIGYAPDSWDATVKFLKERGFAEQEIFLAGLTVKKERGQDFYDRFRDRIMFPINDTHGSPVGFSGRTLKTDEGAKYINTPQTMIYNKSLILYNLDKAKQEIKKQNQAILVEGQMDVLAAWQAGTHNVIASSGTALTLDQIKILKRSTNVVAICFDTDAAGESAARRGIDVALSQEVEVKVISLPQGKDPDECIKNNPDDWLTAIKDARSIMEHYVAQATQKFDSKTVDGKKQIAKLLLPLIAKIGNKIEQTHWLQQLAELLNVSEQILRESLSHAGRPPKAKLQPEAAPPISRNRVQMVSERLLALALKYPHQLPRIIDATSPAMIVDPKLAALYRQLIIYYTEDISSAVDQFDYKYFRQKLSASDLAHQCDTLVLLAERDFADFDHDSLGQETAALIYFLKRNHYSQELKILESEIRQAEQQQRHKDLDALTERFNRVVAQLNILK
jgi:DNA primase